MTYELRPKIEAKDYQIAAQNDKIGNFIRQQLSQAAPETQTVLVFEAYPGVDQDKLLALAKSLQPKLIINALDQTLPQSEVNAKLKTTLTDDRVLGLMTHANMADFFDSEKMNRVRDRIAHAEGLVIVYGVGASLVAGEWDHLAYFDLTRWEIQLRFRKGMNNWLAAPEPDILKQFKRGYFFEWRIADRRKEALSSMMDFVVDTTTNDHWTMITGDTFQHIQQLAVRRPFRLVPYFDASVWGGQWMKETFQLNPGKENYGWAFDGVPEENSVLFQLGNGEFEMPAINLVHNFPLQLLGERVTALFGPEFPIRFDYLDTMGGGNLSLQVHPKVEYIQQQFGMNYTQNESYYILQATSRSTIYLGVKNGTNKKELFEALKEAQTGQANFDDDRFINVFPVNKHDHYSIPAGTIHCGGPDTVVLEISATPYIFTFKLWDWGRIGLDGKPRPIHLDHGEPSADMRFDTDYVKDNLFSKNKVIQQTEQELIEETGLCDLEFIATYRYTFTDTIEVQDHDSVNMLNLVEGDAIELSSQTDAFPPVTIHYGETFIIPESCHHVQVTNLTPSKPVKLLQAFIKD